MILAYFVLLTIPLSYISGGRLKHMAEYPIRCIWLTPLAFIIEAAVPFLRGRIPLDDSQWIWIAVLLEYILLFLFCFINLKEKPVRLILIACFLNFFVIAWYGFRMPVAPIIRDFPQMASVLTRIESGELFEYVLVDYGSPFLFLGDAILLPFMHQGLASIGDIFLAAGVGWLIFRMMRPIPKRKATRQAARQRAY